jgi:hypothetical protein
MKRRVEDEKMDSGNPRLDERRQVIQQYVDELRKIIDGCGAA